jgi:hypothetical protein
VRPRSGLERAGLASGFLQQLAELSVERELPALEERLEVVPAEPAHRVVEAALGDGPLDELSVRVEPVEPQHELEPASQRDERIGGRIRQLGHQVLGLALGDLPEPSGVRLRVQVREGRRAGQHVAAVRVLELGHAREDGLLPDPGEPDPDAPVGAPVARDHLDLGDRTDAPLGALGVADLLADLE